MQGTWAHGRGLAGAFGWWKWDFWGSWGRQGDLKGGWAYGGRGNGALLDDQRQKWENILCFGWVEGTIVGHEGHAGEGTSRGVGPMGDLPRVLAMDRGGLGTE